MKDYNSPPLNTAFENTASFNFHILHKPPQRF